MDCRLTVVTLGVADLNRSRQFYAIGPGWQPTKSRDEDIVFFSAGAIILALYPLDRLAEDAQLAPESTGSGRVTLTENIRSAAEVDATLAQAVAADGGLLKKAGPAF
jgi:catechol 2,3-dioxygenase-like lactoylglutathione lyase family enzyme